MFTTISKLNCIQNHQRIRITSYNILNHNIEDRQCFLRKNGRGFCEINVFRLRVESISLHLNVRLKRIINDILVLTQDFFKGEWKIWCFTVILDDRYHGPFKNPPKPPKNQNKVIRYFEPQHRGQYSVSHETT